jgi:uncharacterized membrane protein
VTRLIRSLAIAAIVVVGAAYLAFSHLLTIDEHPNLLMLVVGVTPLMVMATLAAWHSSMRWIAMLALGVLTLLVVLYLEELRNHVNWLYFMQHVGAMSLLAITFGSTLGRGDADALCSRVTCLLLPSPADPVYMRYTWKVTLAWTVYFSISAILSVTLFFLGPLVMWSFFANLLTPVTVGLMFVVEYLVRVRVLPDREHYSIAQIVHAYRSYERH